MQAQKVFDYINTLISLLPNPSEYKHCNFSLLCDKYPITVNKSIYRAKVLYISLNIADKYTRLYPDKLNEMGLDTVLLTSNQRRRITTNMQEFFVNGNTEEQVYKEAQYYNYSIEKANANTKELIKKLREKYNIQEPKIFVGLHQNLVLE